MPLSPTATRDLLRRLDHRPRHSLGQSFLVDGNIVRKSVDLAEVTAGDLVVEIGPGLGTLTAALLERGAEVWAVELDPILYGYLTAELVPIAHGRLHLLLGDAMDFPLAGLPRACSEAKFKIVANLPYAVATPWLDAVLLGPLPDRMVLMLQQEAAQRYAAEPGTKSFGAISIFLQAAFEASRGHRVAASCFHPRPEIESLLVTLRRRPEPFVFPPAVRDLIRACFQQRRKQIGALLRAKRGRMAQAWLDGLLGGAHPATSRPEAIPVPVWIELSRLVGR
jgi:16S rRNA (adenine1518-N6/adenine1519-N6)-dimethyltransferase